MNEDASIALQQYLEAEVQRRNIPDPITPSDFFDMLLSRANAFANGDYLNRIAQVAYERYIAGGAMEDAPAMIIVPTPMDKRQMADLFGDRRNYVAVFGAESIHFQDTIHALAVDSQREQSANVFGVFANWLSSENASFGRAIILDRDGLVKEVAFAEPVPIHAVQILHLPLKGERQLHRELSRRFYNSGIAQINPYANSSELADDKARTHALWERYDQEIVSPKYALIPQGSSAEEIAERLRIFAGDIAIQPNKGTEGYNVEKFNTGADLESALLYVREQVLPEDDAMVRERRGNVRYTDRASGSFLNVTFRVNVVWNGSEFVAESGYAQTARDENTFPASRGRGGSIVDINEALANLYYEKSPLTRLFLRGEQERTAPDRWSRFIPVDEDISGMKRAAENAARALNAGLDKGDYLKHTGIDILLEVDKARAIPVVLEANPRPAGLSYSSEIVGISSGKPQQRIGAGIFKLMRTLTTE